MTESTRTDVLRRAPIFAGLDAEELATLTGMAAEYAFGDTEFIFLEGDPPHRFYIVEEGRVKVVKHSTSGKELLIAVFAPGEMFGEVAVFEGRAYPASARATGDTRVLGIGRERFLHFLSEKPQVSLKIIGVLGERLRQAHTRLRDLVGERVEQRIASILLMLSGKMGPTLPFTRQEIAEMAGTTTETAIRVLSRLGKGHIVRSSRGRITILDPTRLRLLSEGPPIV